MTWPAVVIGWLRAKAACFMFLPSVLCLFSIFIFTRSVALRRHPGGLFPLPSQVFFQIACITAMFEC